MLNPSTRRWREAFIARVGSLGFVEDLFDRLPDVVFSIKDRQGRYVGLSKAALARCALEGRTDVIGRTAFDLFPAPMAERYTRQDERLYRTGKPIIDNLDLTLLPDRSHGWCLTCKEPIRDRNGEIIGLACISRDLLEPSRSGLIDAAFAETIDYIHDHLDATLRTEMLANRAGLSTAQFERRMKKIFLLTPAQYLIKTRIEHAARLLAGSDLAIASIALTCGFADQSSLSRQFRQLIGFTPRQYRAHMNGSTPSV